MIFFVMGAVILGVILGVICREVEDNKRTKKLIRWTKSCGRKRSIDKRSK